MIEFVTLYLGLVAGIQPLEVSVGPEVSAVEIVLDSRTMATMHGEPWRLPFDFGARLVPHHLEAIARDSAGDELARAEQWMNLPRPRAEAKLSLEMDEKGSLRWARVIWEAVDFDQPRRVEAFLDGQALKVEEMGRIELPKMNPEIIHFLSAELEFSDTVSAHAEIVFGGTYGDTVSSELTSIVLETDRSRPPKLAQLQGRLLLRGTPLQVVAVERPPIEIIVVREQSTGMFESIQRLITTGASQRTSLRFQLPRILRPADRVRFALTSTDNPLDTSSRYDQIPVTQDLTQPRDAKLFEILSRIGPVGTRHALSQERVTDAVAIAGLVGAASNRRRVVILLSAFENQDVSRLVPATVRDYLNGLMVPLVVWKLTPPNQEDGAGPTGWGPAVDISDWGGVGAAFRELENLLGSQVIVWVEGRHLQHEISIAPGTPSLRLAQRNSQDLDDELRRLTESGRSPIAPPDITTGEDQPENRADNQIALIDAEQFERARKRLSSPESFVPLGPINLFTDKSAPGLWKSLERVSRQVPELFSLHYGVQADLDTGAAVVLLAEEASYRAYEAEIGIGGGNLTGHTSPGLVVLYAGKRSPQEIRRTFTHELVHLLTLQAIGPSVPPWLDEGLAESMNFAAPTGGDSLTLGPLDPRRLRAGTPRAIAGPLSLLERLADDSRGTRLPRLADLIEMKRDSFLAGDEADALYALSALWVHYLGTVNTETRVGFRSYLKNLVEESTGDPQLILTFLDVEADSLERAFRSWLQWLATELSAR